MLHGGLSRPRTPATDPVRAAAFPELDRRLVRDGSGRPLVVGLSGGSDSLALLHLAAAWARAWGRPVEAATVDHGLSPEAPAWGRFARAAAERAGVGWTELRWEGAKPAAGLPAAARRARHALLARFARDRGAAVVLLGHTANDLAEGEAMRAGEARGLGRLRTWSPSPVWPEGRGVFLLRPLLRLRREGLRAWLAEAGEAAWVEDPANADPRFARARARAAGVDAGRVRPAPASPALRRLARGAEVDGAGRIAVARSVLRAAPADAAQAFTAIACTCAGGGERPPRGPAAADLLAHLAGASPVERTLARAQVRADAREIVFTREAGRSGGEAGEGVRARLLAACGAIRREAEIG